jgi:phosphotransferase system HPr (HPr) family protein
MVHRQLTISNRLGLHARAAAQLVSLSNSFQSNSVLKCGNQEVNANSIIAIMLLAATQGSVVDIMVEGEDEIEHLEALETLIADKFNEE